MESATEVRMHEGCLNPCTVWLVNGVRDCGAHPGLASALDMKVPVSWCLIFSGEESYASCSVMIPASNEGKRSVRLMTMFETVVVTSLLVYAAHVR